MRQRNFRGPVPSTTEQFQSLMGHRAHGMRLLRRPEWLALDPARRPAIVSELADIQERLHLALCPVRKEPFPKRWRV